MPGLVIIPIFPFYTPGPPPPPLSSLSLYLSLLLRSASLWTLAAALVPYTFKDFFDRKRKTLWQTARQRTKRTEDVAATRKKIRLHRVPEDVVYVQVLFIDRSSFH